MYEMELRFSSFGTGLDRLALANHFTSITKADPDVIQEFEPLAGVDNATNRIGLAAFAMNKLTILGTDNLSQAVELGLTPKAGETFWRQTRPGAFEAIIADASGTDALRITRTFELLAGQYTFRIDQRVENLTDSPLTLIWHQFGPVDLPLGIVRYGGDVRRVRFGFQRPTALDPDQIVLADDGHASYINHTDALGTPVGVFASTNLPRWEPKTLWPSKEAIERKYTLAWAGVTSRYFAVGMFGASVPGVQSSSQAGSQAGRGTDKAFALAATFDRLAIPPSKNLNLHASGAQGVMALRFASNPLTIAPGKSADVSVGVYAGPQSKKYIAAQPLSAWHGFERVIIYTFGGPCGFCTFQPVALTLRAFMGVLHDHVFFDWALAIMFLVVCVRTILHPVTRWSQTSLLRFGKQMQSLAPKQKVIQEKFKNDPVKMREEMGRLMREENVNYAGALGCLPMFLQTPVWIALYAMLYFTFELRHSHAFFGVIQAITGHKWSFMGDLAEPDNFVNFHSAFGASPDGVWVPLLSSLMGPIQGLNILPLVLGVVFYIQQKYMQPPVTTTLTPEQEQQQKIMKVMTVVMFPLFMYNAPSGLALYFMVNSTLGIVESKWVRSHAEKKIEAEIARRKANPRRKDTPEKPPGFLARMQTMVAERQAMMEEERRQAEKRKK